MGLKQLAGCRNVPLDGESCGGGSCPAIFLSEDGKLIVQGNKLPPSQRAGMSLPGNEDAVEISIALLEEAIAGLRKV